MSQPAISVRGLSKEYRLGARERATRSLREAIMEGLAAPVRRLRSLGQPPDPEEHVWALRDVSFEVQPGEVLGVVGRNGAGKSTLLKVLSRITEPTQGRVEIRGRVASLLEVGTGFHPELSGRENIYLNGSILGMTRREVERDFDNIVEFAGVERFVDTPVKRYSSGMYLRLAFAVAAHLRPEIMLVDEVLAVGDATFQRRCIGKMEEVARSGRTVLFVSHNLFSVQSLCTSGLLLAAGQLVTAGTVDHVLNRYLEMGSDRDGEVVWNTPEEAPGNSRTRIHAVRVVQNGATTGEAAIAEPLRIEMDYWNFEPDVRRMISFHCVNSTGVTVFTSMNMPSAGVTPDPWYGRQYPVGLFRTSCEVPGQLLNDGRHSVSVYITEGMADNVVYSSRDILTFTVLDDDGMRQEYSGPWLGAVRPRLHWQTEQLA